MVEEKKEKLKTKKELKTDEQQDEESKLKPKKGFLKRK